MSSNCHGNGAEKGQAPSSTPSNLKLGLAYTLHLPLKLMKRGNTKMKKSAIRILGLFVALGSLSACSLAGHDPFYQAWYDVYGNQCGNGNPKAGCNFYSNGAKISSSQDPYAGQANYTFDFWSYNDSYGVHHTYSGYAWMSPDGVLYDNNGNALNSEESANAPSADVIAQAAAEEKKVATEVGKVLAQKYALAEDQGIMISKTLQAWAVLGRDRARSDNDTADFTSRLYGVNADKAKSAITQALATQSQSPLDDLNVDVAAHWGTSPETSKQILKGWYKDEVATYGIK